MGRTQKLCPLNLMCTFLLNDLGDTVRKHTSIVYFMVHNTLITIEVKKDYNTLIKIFKEMEFTGKFKLEAQ